MKTLTSHYPFQSTPRKIIQDGKMALHFPVFNTWAYLKPNCLFQAILAFLLLQGDYSRGRQIIIRLLSLPVSRGGRLKLLGGCPPRPRRLWVGPGRTSAWWDNFLTEIVIVKANAHGSSMRSRVFVKNVVFNSIHRIRVGGRKRCVNATCGHEFFLKTKKKTCVFKRIRIRVHGALVVQSESGLLLVDKLRKHIREALMHQPMYIKQRRANFFQDYPAKCNPF